MAASVRKRRVKLKRLLARAKRAVDYAAVEMQMGVQRRAERMNKVHRPETGIAGCVQAAPAQCRFHFGQENPKDRIDQPGILVEEIPQAFWKR